MATTTVGVTLCLRSCDITALSTDDELGLWHSNVLLTVDIDNFVHWSYHNQ